MHEECAQYDRARDFGRCCRVRHHLSRSIRRPNPAHPLPQRRLPGRSVATRAESPRPPLAPAIHSLPPADRSASSLAKTGPRGSLPAPHPTLEAEPSPLEPIARDVDTSRRGGRARSNRPQAWAIPRHHHGCGRRGHAGGLGVQPWARRPGGGDRARRRGDHRPARPRAAAGRRHLVLLGPGPRAAVLLRGLRDRPASDQR